MTYGFNNFLGILFLGWIIVLLTHEAVGGILSIFYRRFAKDQDITIQIK